jgi:diacylglycerol O-acyltransferase-1
MPLDNLRDAVTSLYASTGDVKIPKGDVSTSSPKDDIKPRITTDNVPSYRSHPALNPVHTRFATSPLSTAEVGTGTSEEAKVDFRGILNLFFIILFVLNVRLIVENMIRYGSLIQMPRINLFDSPLIFLGYVLVLSLPYLSFVCERYIAESNRSFAHAIQSFLILVTLVGPYLIVSYYPSVHPLRSLLLLMASIVYAMKIGSYWHVCSDLYDMKRAGNLSKVVPTKSSSVETEILALSQQYPKSLTISQMYMFIAYPTLVFQLSYPRTNSIRLRILFRYVAELVFCLVLQFILIEQYITPLLNNTISGTDQRIVRKESFVNMAWFLLERFLKLVIPNLYIWLLMFAELFHCYLNILAELTRFGDRKFYHDWWNAVSIRDYWQKWNQPVHHWLLRHLYKPFRKLGLNQQNAATIVFIISGIVHEYLIITPIGIPWNGFVTLGFILQLPLISLTDTQFVKDRPTIGNCLFWITSCFTGQPLATLLYFVAASSPTIFTRLIGWAYEGFLGSHDEL